MSVTRLLHVGFTSVARRLRIGLVITLQLVIRRLYAVNTAVTVTRCLHVI